MITYLEYSDGKSDKFWQIEVTGDSFTVTYGKIGTDGQSKTKTFGSADEAEKEAEKRQKTGRSGGGSHRRSG